MVIIDEDLGLSGSSTDGARGFARLMQRSRTRAPVGIVLGLEVSRLAEARAVCAYRLLELCSMPDTLIR